MKNCVCPAIAVVLSLFSIVPAMALADTPQVEVMPPQEPIHPGKPAIFTYRLSWPADGAAWRVPAPSLEQPDWGQVHLQSASTYTAGDQTVAEFALGIIARKTGDFELPAVAFDIYPAEDVPKNETAPLKAPPADWSTAQSVESESVPVAVVADYGQWVTMGAVGVGVAALVLVGGWTVLRLTSGSVATPQVVSDDPREFVHAARKHRLDGDFYGFFLSLGEAAGKAKGPDAARLMTQHNERAREVGYGGVRPTDDEMDAALKDTERLLTATSG